MLVALFAGTSGITLADDGQNSSNGQNSFWATLAKAFNTTIDNFKNVFNQTRNESPGKKGNGPPPRDDQQGDGQSQGKQQGNGPSSGTRQGNNPPSGGQGNHEQRAKEIARAAELLGVSVDDLTTAFETADKNLRPAGGQSGSQPAPSQFGDTTGGSNPPPPPGSQGKQSGGKGGPGGQPPPRPSDNMTTGRPGGNPQPPQGGQGGPGKGPDMTAVYAAVAQAMSLPADKVTAAFEQAREELKPADNHGQNTGNGSNNNNSNGNGNNNGNNNTANQGGSAAGGYSLDQAMSEKAQLSTIAFSGLAFITGSAGADSFFPPGKVADFFGFQYMRDVDTAGYGHNTTFLSKAANNVLKILTAEQKAKFVALANEQEPLYVNFAYNRFPLMAAFRNNLEGKLPAGATGLSADAVKAYTSNLYNLDAQLSYRRAEVVGGVIASLTADQKAYLSKMEFDDSSTWSDVAEDETLKKSMTNTQFVAVMTYASELFSWYKGSIEADIYFCPERHGTYFGGFYMKDYPAMNNPDYFISTATTGDNGEGFLNILNTTQRQRITGIIEEQAGAIKEIAGIRTSVSTELRKAMTGQSMDREKVYSLIKRYGELDGQVSGLYASRFAEVNKTLSADQRASLVKLRNLAVVPKGAYFFSTPINYPALPSTDYLFGIGQAPSSSGQLTAPSGFATSTESRPNPPAKK